MPFNAAGVYSLPQPAFVTGTTISSTAVNSNFSDIASALTTSYQISLNTAAQLQGNCQLTKSAASTLKLSPYNGNSLLIEGQIRTITSGGVTLALAGLTPATLYYVYAYWSGSVVTLEASTTTHTTDTTYGNEVKSGDATRSLVGAFYATAVNDTVDTNARRLVVSWFNPPDRLLVGTTMNSVTSTVTTLGEISASTGAYRVDFVKFANRPGTVNFGGTTTNSGAPAVGSNIGIDTATAASDESRWQGGAGANGPFEVNLPLEGTAFTEGYHIIIPLGYTVGVGTATWSGTIRGWLL